MWEKLLSLINKYPIVEISDFISIIPIIIGVFFYKSLSKEFKLLLYFLVVYFLLGLYSTWLSVLTKNNIYILNFVEILEISTICLIFFQINSQSYKRFLMITLLGSAIFVGFWKFDFIEFAYFPYVLNRLSYVIIVFIYFHTLLSEISAKNILTHPPFWLCAGLVIYSTGSVLIFLFGKQIFSINAPDKLFLQFYNIISIINIMFRLLIGVSFFVSKYEK